MNWYDVVAPIYNRAIRGLYQPYRETAVRSLCLEPGHTVLDLGCGSGLNFELIMETIGDRGTLIGVDSSAKMLGHAREAIERHGWANVFVLEEDARQLERGALERLTSRPINVDRILCTLGFSVFPDWQKVFENSLELLASEGRYCVMDLFNEGDTFHTRLVNALASSEISRRVWDPLKEQCDDYEEERHPLRHGQDVVVIASGAKRPVGITA